MNQENLINAAMRVLNAWRASNDASIGCDSESGRSYWIELSAAMDELSKAIK